MDDTIRHLANVLGGTGLESLGHASRFTVDGDDGSRLTVRIENNHQRLVAELVESNGTHRADLDVAPIRKVQEDPKHPGRVVLYVGTMEIRLDTQPQLAVNVVSAT